MATTDEDERVVRTTLDAEAYEEFRQVAEQRDLSVEEGVKRAIRDYVDLQDDLASLLDTVDDLDDTVGEPTDASDMDDDLYGATTEDAHR